MSNYLIELGVVHLVLMLAYWVFLRKERQYAIMRVYLIGAMILALAIPLFKLPTLFNRERAIEVMSAEVVSFESEAISPPDDTSVNSIDIMIGIYIAVSIFFLYKFLNSVIRLVYLRYMSQFEKLGDLYIHKIKDGKTSFSFFNWIFLSDTIDKSNDEYLVMLEHEKAHASLGHTYDIIFLQLFRASFWWLPTAWFVNKEIKKIHEYQADAYVLRSYSFDQYSSILISSTLKLNGITLVSSFYDGLILKRLTAMKQETKKVSPWKLGALTALCAMLFTALACTEDQKSEVARSDKQGKDIFVVVEQMAQAEGGITAFYNQIENEITYPADALQKRVEGQVYVEFVVEKNGSLSDVKAINGIGAGCDEEAVRAVQNASKFKPASQRGKPVRVRMVLPIAFQIDESSTGSGSIHVLEIQPVYARFKVNVDYNSGEWSGVVYDEEGEGLPGVNIVVEGTTTGTVSDLNGSFKVEAVETENLNLSFVGYESIRLNNKELSR